VGSWSFLTNHGKALFCLANDPTIRLRHLATRLGITERRAHSIVDDLVQSGYVVKSKDGRHNRYRIVEKALLKSPSDEIGTKEFGTFLASVMHELTTEQTPSTMSR
jgi:predicted transcriptional regulator